MKMNKKPSPEPETKVARIIGLFKTSPTEAFQSLLEEGIFFNHKQSVNFWQSYSAIYSDELVVSFPESTELFNKLVWLKLFHDLNQFYNSEKDKNLKELYALNPNQKDFVQALFLCLELGTYSYPYSTFPIYSGDSLTAIKTILKEVKHRLNPQKPSPYSPALAQTCNTLLKIQIDLDSLEEFVDAYVWAGLEMEKLKDLQGFSLSISERNKKELNPLVLNQIKTIIKRTYKQTESHAGISTEKHFIKNDPKWKSNEGILGAIALHGATIHSKTPGITAINAEPGEFPELDVTNPHSINSIAKKAIETFLTHNFHLQLRQAISSVYQPNDEIDIKTIQIEVKPNMFFSLFELIAAMSSLISWSDAYRYFADFPDSGSIKSIKRKLYHQLSSQDADLSEFEKHEIINWKIVSEFQLINSAPENIFYALLSSDSIINKFRDVEELRDKSPIELESILHLFSDLNIKTPFNPIYTVNSDYYFANHSCLFNMNRMLYDNYISDELFNSKKPTGKQRKHVGDLQKNRELQFGNSISDVFKEITPYSKANIKFDGTNPKYNFGDLKGELDTAVYFESENILFVIEVKLSNVAPRSEKRKYTWVYNNIANKHKVNSGVNQIKKDLKLLSIGVGLQLISEEINAPSTITNPRVYPIIITDNFFADHEEFIYNERGDKVRCISYFELKHLILNKPIHEQQKLPELKGESIASQLIKAIDNNLFWKFITDEAANYSYTKSLTAINDEFKITMKI
ncbi:MAG TPA: hypothetical protein VFW78_03600 [Bacteroidia bacterium]|nr:hypothetical protein [Bacteroidia bacterium]